MGESVKMILQKMLSFMEKYHMLDGCKTLVIGVSGGAVPSASCFCWKGLQRAGILPVVVHIEHGIRGKRVFPMPRLWKTSANRRISCFTGFPTRWKRLRKRAENQRRKREDGSAMIRFFRWRSSMNRQRSRLRTMRMTRRRPCSFISRVEAA